MAMNIFFGHFQGLQRRNRVFNDFPQGEVIAAICGVARV